MVYRQRALLVLALLGTLSFILSLMSGGLIFQLHDGVKESESAVSDEVFVVLKPISAVMSVLSLILSCSSAVICLLHAYISAELWRDHTHRVEWFLSESRSIRHVAVGLFCSGLCIYLCALSIYMLVVFEIETGITSTCLLSSGVMVLIIIIAYSFMRSSRTAKHYSDQHADIMYQNNAESNAGICTVASDLCCREKTTRQHTEDCQLCYNHSPDLTQQHPAFSTSPNHSRHREAYAEKRYMHRTQSAESGLYQSRTKPWGHQRRTMLTPKSKEATLV